MVATLEQLAAQLGTTIAYLWPVLCKAIRMEALMMIVIWLAFAATVAVLVPRLRRRANGIRLAYMEHNRSEMDIGDYFEYHTGFVVVCIAMGIVIIALCMTSAIGGASVLRNLWYPEVAALELIAGAL